MILYNITFNLDSQIEKEWLEFMEQVYVKQALLSGLVLEHRILRLLSTIYEQGGVTYSFQFNFSGLADVGAFEKNHVPQLNDQLLRAYNGKFASFATILEDVV